MTRARLKLDGPPVAFRAVVEWSTAGGPSHTDVFGPYGTVGAAKAAVTREIGNARFSSIRHATGRVEAIRADAWEAIE